MPLLDSDTATCPLTIDLGSPLSIDGRRLMIRDTINGLGVRPRLTLVKLVDSTGWELYRWDDRTDDMSELHFAYGPFWECCNAFIWSETPPNVVIDALLECEETPDCLRELLERLAANWTSQSVYGSS